MCEFTLVEKMGTFGVCMSIAHCLEEVTEDVWNRLMEVASRIGMSKEQVDSCIDDPESIPKIVPADHEVRVCALECFIYVAIDGGIIANPDQAMYIEGASNAFEISDLERDAIFKKVAKVQSEGNPEDSAVSNPIQESEQISPTQQLGNLFHSEEKPTLGQVKECLAAGANPNAKNNAGFSILMIACATKQSPEVIEALIKAGADVHATNENGFTALFGACQPFDEVTGELASKARRIESINVMLNAGADINHQTGEGPDSENPFVRAQLTPLHVAAGPESDEVVEFMLKNGADPNIPDALKRTPLFASVAGGDMELAKVLIDGGADFNVTAIHIHNPETGEPIPVSFEYNGVEGETDEIFPLDLAVMHEEYEMATMLHKRGAPYTPGLTQLELTMEYDPSDEENNSEECSTATAVLERTETSGATKQDVEFDTSDWKTKENKRKANKLWKIIKCNIVGTSLFETMGDKKAGELFRPSIKGFPLCSYCISQHANIELRIKHGSKDEGTRLFDRLEDKKFAIENLMKENLPETLRVTLVFDRNDNPRNSHKIKLETLPQEEVWSQHTHSAKDPVVPEELWDEVVRILNLLLSPFEQATMDVLHTLGCE